MKEIEILPCDMLIHVSFVVLLPLCLQVSYLAKATKTEKQKKEKKIGNFTKISKQR